jgi:hypothetical protein
MIAAACAAGLLVASAGLGLNNSSAFAEPRTFSVTVAGGNIAGGSNVFRVQQNDSVTMEWTSDKKIEVHLHGYNILLKVGVDAPARMEIDAKATGRFPLTLHGHGGKHGHGAIGYLEVLPE